MEDDACVKLAEAMAREMEGQYNSVIGKALVILLAAFTKTLCDDESDIDMCCLSMANDAADLAKKHSSILQ